MSSGRHANAADKPRRSGSASKIILLFLAFTLVFGAAVGGTVAWLMADTDPVVNTFTYGNIEIDLEETDTEKDNDDDPNTNTYEMFPGRAISKDPRVIVRAENEACWLFVRITQSSNFGDFMTYDVADGWAQLRDENGDAVSGVWYMEVEEDRDSQDKTVSVLKDDCVTVKDEVTREMLQNLSDSGDYPTMTFVAYAVQRESIDSAYEAWTLAQEAETE